MYECGTIVGLLIVILCVALPIWAVWKVWNFWDKYRARRQYRQEQAEREQELQQQWREEQAQLEQELQQQWREEQAQLEQRRKKKAERAQLIARIIVTSGSRSLEGWRVVRQLDLVTCSQFKDEDQTLRELKYKASLLGANAITDIRVTRAAGGWINMRGNAVYVEEAQRGRGRRSG